MYCLAPLQGRTTHQAFGVPAPIQDNGAPRLDMQQQQEGALIASSPSTAADDVTVQVTLLSKIADGTSTEPQCSFGVDVWQQTKSIVVTNQTAKGMPMQTSIAWQ